MIEINGPEMGVEEGGSRVAKLHARRKAGRERVVDDEGFEEARDEKTVKEATGGGGY